MVSYHHLGGKAQGRSAILDLRAIVKLTGIQWAIPGNILGSFSSGPSVVLLGLPWASDWKQEGKKVGIQAAPTGQKKGISPPPGAVQAEGELTWPRGWELQVGLRVGSPEVETDAGGCS